MTELMSGTSTLRNEHKAIGKMLQVFKIMASKIQAGSLDELEAVEKPVDFFKNFVDRCHHRKEEEILFPLLVKKGIPGEGGPIGVMLAEHALGRNFIKNLFDTIGKIKSGDTSVAAYLVNDMSGYASLLEKHIVKENEVLFNMAEQILTPGEQADLDNKFERLEIEEIGEGVHEQYHHMIHDLINKYGLN